MEQQTHENLEAVAEVSEQIFPPKDDEIVLDDGRKVVAQKIKMKHNAFMIRLVEKLIAELGVDEKGNVTIPLSDRTKLLQLIAKFPDDLNHAMSLLSSLSLEEVEDLDLADGVKLLLKIVEVNKNFFIEKVVPLIMSVGLLGQAASETDAARVKRTRKN